MAKYSKINIIYLLQKWMDSVPGQTFLNYAYSWGAAIVILGTLFKLTYLPGADIMLFIGMGTEVIVFFISAFDRPFDKSTIDMTLDNHMDDQVIDHATASPLAAPIASPDLGTTIIGTPAGNNGSASNDSGNTNDVAAASTQGGAITGAPISGGTVIIGNGMNIGNASPAPAAFVQTTPSSASASQPVATETASISFDNAESTQENTQVATQEAVQATIQETVQATTQEATMPQSPRIVTPAPAVTPETAEAMEVATSQYVSRLNELNEMLEKVAAQSARLATDSEEMENLNRTLTGISRVYEMQLKSASQQITTQDEINEQTRRMAKQIQELNAIYTRMIEAMTVNMNPLAPKV